MATRILDLPVATFTMTVSTNEDWLDGLGAYYDANGGAISLDGLALDFQMRPQGAGFAAPLSASTGPTVGGMPVSGSVLVSGNGVGLSFARAVMSRLTPGGYDAELQARGDGLTRTIGRYTVIVVQGVIR